MSTASSRAAPVPTEAPSSTLAADENRLGQLEALRAELDRVDDSLHDMLMRRAELVVQVGALGAKGRVPLRPGREASILRRLIARNRGALAPATLVRVWREMLAGSSAQQNQMTVAIGDPALDAVTREHFGALIQAEATDPAGAIAHVAHGGATLAILPFPSGTARWWADLAVDDRWPRVHVVARLPFWGRVGAVEALVLSTAAPDPSGRDRSLIACDTPTALDAAGFAVGETYPDASIVLADVDGFVTPEDARLRGLSARVLGAYAVPVGDFA